MYEINNRIQKETIISKRKNENIIVKYVSTVSSADVVRRKKIF